MTINKVPFEAQRARGIKTRNAMIEIITKSDQPLVTSEVHAMLAQRGIGLDRSYVGDVLNHLTAEGLISSRPETADERAIRTSDRRGAHFTTTYYWAPVGKVPFRTKPSTVRPISRTKVKKKKQTAKTSSPRVSAQTSSIDLMSRIENMTAELALLKRVAELEAQLETIRKAIS